MCAIPPAVVSGMARPDRGSVVLIVWVVCHAHAVVLLAMLPAILPPHGLLIALLHDRAMCLTGL